MRIDLDKIGEGEIMLKKIRAIYGKNPDFCALSAIIGAFLILFSVDMLFLNHGTVWGSVTDWSCQHFAIPEYLRMRFYETHDFFPDFAMQLGGGQNIYNLAYYGIMNPLYLPAYFMPWMTMATYIQLMSIAVTLISTVMAYYFFKKHFTGAIPLVLAVMFICAGPIVYHSHRHIMFVNYFPFLFGLLFTVRGRDSAKNLLLTAVFTFCIICASFYFSIGAFAAVGVYMIYLAVEREGRFSLTAIWKYIWKKLLLAVLGCICAAVLWLPAMSATVMGRAKSSVEISLLRLLIPSVELDLLLYSPMSPGVTCIVAAAVIAIIAKGKKHERFLAAVILSFVLFPAITYVLNAGMYIDGKALIPFIPLILLLCGSFFRDFICGEVNAKLTAVILAAAVIATIAEGVRTLSQQILIILDMLVTVLVMLFSTKAKRQKYILIQTVAFSLITGIAVCCLDKLAKRSDVDEFYSSDASYMVNDILDNSSEAFRFAEETGQLKTVNRVYRTDYLTTNIYSSLSNKSFRDFRFHNSGSEVTTRNNAIQLQPMNIIFNSLMGCRYRLTSADNLMFGETEKAVSGKYHVYENANAMPLGYASADVMSEKEYSALPWEQRQEAVLSNIIIPTGVDRGIVPHMTNQLKLNLEEVISGEGISINEGVISVDRTKPISFDIKLDEPIDGDLLLIKCISDNRIGRLKKQKDIILTINGVDNKLCAPTWKYHNGNYSFTYTISSSEPIEKLNMTFSKGKYRISGIEAYVLDSSALTDAMKNKDKLTIKHSRYLGDDLIGNINVTKDGWFTASIPYDENFRITVDGKETEYFRTNTAFIGFPIAAGEHEIAITYEAPMKKAGIAIGASAAIAIFILLCIFGIHDRIKATSKK